MASITNRLEHLETRRSKPRCRVCGDGWRMELRHIVGGKLASVTGEVCAACGSPDRTIIEIVRVEAQGEGSETTS